jgi:hypothetical protein
MVERGPVGPGRWAHWLGLSHKVSVMKYSGQELFKILQPKVTISRVRYLQQRKEKNFTHLKNRSTP